MIPEMPRNTAFQGRSQKAGQNSDAPPLADTTSPGFRIK